MTGRTHDLAAFTALGYVVVTYPLHPFSLATGLLAIGANLVGGIAPDIDQPTAHLWNQIPAGSIIGRLICPMLGGHRLISHSILGIFLFGFLAYYALNLTNSFLIIDHKIVWTAFIIGFISHLIMDTITKEGVPWLFPFPWKIGIPPFKHLRIKTGGLVEKAIIFPMLMVLNIYLYYTHYHVILDLLRHHIK